MARIDAIFRPFNCHRGIIEQCAMRTEQARPVRLADYRPPDWLVDTVHLDVALHPTATRVRAKLRLKPNPAAEAPAPIVLDGDGLNLAGIALDGAALSADDVEQVSKWPSRGEQLSLLLGQILSPGANLVSQLCSAGGLLASQIEQIADGEAGGGGGEASAAVEEAAPAPETSAPAEGGDAAGGSAESPAAEGEAPPAAE
jgi:hypothetical protein